MNNEPVAFINLDRQKKNTLIREYVEKNCQLDFDRWVFARGHRHTVYTVDISHEFIENYCDKSNQAYAKFEDIYYMLEDNGFPEKDMIIYDNSPWVVLTEEMYHKNYISRVTLKHKDNPIGDNE